MPHQLSGGRVQRVAIARGVGLIVRRIILANEPTGGRQIESCLIMEELIDLHRRGWHTSVWLPTTRGMSSHYADRVITSGRKIVPNER